MNRLGQHFLKNKAVIKRMVAALEIKPKETILEVGPGHGELTIPLARTCEKKNCKILSIEKDEKLAGELEFKIKNFGLNKVVKIVRDDALRFVKNFPKSEISAKANQLRRNFSEVMLRRGKLNPKSSYKIVGNIPFYITGRLLRYIGELKSKPSICVFTLQKEVAERLTAKPPKMNRLASSVQLWAEAKIIAYISKTDFKPKPEVDAAVVVLKTEMSAAAIKNSEKILKALFAQPRKTILNNLANPQVKKSKEEIAKILEKIGVNPQNRPQDLSIEDIIRLSRLI